MEESPPVLSVLVYVVRPGKSGGTEILLIAQPTTDGVVRYNGLGGKVEHGEGPSEAARREVLEESGLVVNELSLQGMLYFPASGDERAWWVVVFRASCNGDTPTSSREGEVRWVAYEALFGFGESSEGRQTYPMSAGDYLFVPWVIEGRGFHGTIAYDADGSLARADLACTFHETRCARHEI